MTRSAREARPERAVETIAEAVAARRNARLGAQLQPVELVVEDDVHDAGNGAGPPCGGRAARHQFDPLDKVRRHEIEVVVAAEAPAVDERQGPGGAEAATLDRRRAARGVRSEARRVGGVWQYV